eukprot:1626066-Ditylum_brightwellii.AAC.1
MRFHGVNNEDLVVGSKGDRPLPPDPVEVGVDIEVRAEAVLVVFMEVYCVGYHVEGDAQPHNLHLFVGCADT